MQLRDPETFILQCRNILTRWRGLEAEVFRGVADTRAETVLHEIGHAVVLGTRTFKDSYKLEKAIKQQGNSLRGEVRTLAAELIVVRACGDLIVWDEEVFLEDVCRGQVMPRLHVDTAHLMTRVKQSARTDLGRRNARKLVQRVRYWGR